MTLLQSSRKRFLAIFHARRHRNIQAAQGSAVFVVIVLLSIMAILIAGNGVALRNLHQELHIIEKKQLERHQTAPAQKRPDQLKDSSPRATMEKPQP